MNNVNIRKMKVEDFEQVHNLVEQVHNLHVKNVPTIYKDTDPLSFEDFCDQLNDINVISYVAEIENKIVGELIAFIKEIKNDKLLVNNKILHIDDICINENYKHKGIGTLLYKTAEEIANKNSCNCIQLNVWNFNKTAIEFYTHNDMKPIFTRYEKSLN